MLLGFLRFKLTALRRHAELEAAASRDASVQKMKKNLKLVMIALVVLGIEKCFDFMLAITTERGHQQNNCQSS